MIFKVGSVGAGKSVAVTPWSVAWLGQMGNCPVLEAGFAVMLFLHSCGNQDSWVKAGYKNMDITGQICLTSGLTHF